MLPEKHLGRKNKGEGGVLCPAGEMLHQKGYCRLLHRIEAYSVVEQQRHPFVVVLESYEETFSFVSPPITSPGMVVNGAKEAINTNTFHGAGT